jgi:hypothetical protein
MGASPIGFSVAASASSDEMVWLTPAQAVELDWSNNGRLPTQVENQGFWMRDRIFD